MNQLNQQKHFEDFVTKMRETMLKKGNDYAGNTDLTDRLSNFKQAGFITNVHPAKVALVIMAVKISRICTLLDSGIKPSNESVQDSSLDLACYSILNDAILNEEKYASVYEKTKN